MIKDYDKWVHDNIGKVRKEKREYKTDGGPSYFAKMYWIDPDTGVIKDIVVFKAPQKLAKKWGFRWDVEIYSGANYVPCKKSAKESSYSRQYREGEGLPKKYVPVVNRLKKELNIR